MALEALALKIVLLAASLEKGDATGNDICGMQRILAGKGHDVSIMVPENRSEQKTLKPDLQILRKADCIIYHLSIHWEAALTLLREAGRPVVLRYHNITPGEFFRPYRPDLGELCDRGRASTQELSRLSCAALANSACSAKELDGLVAEDRIFVLPPLHEIDALQAEPPSEHILRSLKTYPEKEATFLSVGRVAPNKNHALMIEALAHYRDRYPEARLLIAGKLDPSLKAYLNELRALLRRYHLNRSVTFTGSLTLSELKACYCSADALLALSLHEGFCVPPLEAMALMVPVVSSARAALAETAPFAVVPPQLDAAHVAAAMEAVQTKETRNALVAGAFAHYIENFSMTSLSQRLLQIWATLFP